MDFSLPSWITALILIRTKKQKRGRKVTNGDYPLASPGEVICWLVVRLLLHESIAYPGVSLSLRDLLQRQLPFMPQESTKTHTPPKGFGMADAHICQSSLQTTKATDQSTVLAILAITTLAAGKATEFAGVVSSSATTVTSLEVDL
ncbi:hypothetical protein GRJ2_001195800 [Grus japonensis]|uniref:Uncharacterized protein n=1 Tax=Grus japonensis TaxID=30415 RepID=A0ABC9WQ72_GRUJA